MKELQAEILARGEQIFSRMRGDTPGAFSRRSLTGRLMDWSMNNEALKVQLFRLVDVLPALGSAREIARHAKEYLGDTHAGLPAVARWGVQWAPAIPWLTAWIARLAVERMARTFIVARNGAEAAPILRQMRRRPMAFTADILGEAAVSEKEAEAYAARYMELVEQLAAEASRWPNIAQIDTDDRGPVPKANVSVKISALHSQIHATDPEGAIKHLVKRLVPLLRRAQELGVFINFDMESTALKDLTLELFRQVLEDPSLRDYAHAGIAIQAYLRSSRADLTSLIDWARARNRRITIRLIKGAYWDTETILAQQRGWPVPVFQHKPETDANYEELAGIILQHRAWINGAFGTHSIRSMASCIVQAERLGLAPNAYEFQMLYGMAEPIKEALVGMGFRLREYCPVGEILPGMSYLVRRLLENTSNEGFLRATFSEKTSPAELLRDPVELLAASRTPLAATSPNNASFDHDTPTVSGSTDRRSRHEAIHVLPTFANEPATDFTVGDNREKMGRALANVRARLGRSYGLLVNGTERRTRESIASINPSRPDEVVGWVAKADRSDGDAAVAAARAAGKSWARKPVEHRARVLEEAARIMQAERFDLAALEVFETGKPWVESDADVAEAIDFCHFYAQEMRRIAVGSYSVPGETSIQHYVPRGVALVIAPWNFPLAILCGMTAAALVTGNSVIMKPAEQSAVVAAWFMDILQRADVPSGVVQFLPGPGEDVGAYLVEHPQVDLIAFTGSRTVGTQICEAAGRTRPGQANLKKVVCEMGGKNALIVDSDADLDEAVPAILASAFGYQGQKCSALSRLIVLRGAYDRLLERLVEAARGLTIGLPEDPATVVGPVIDADAYKRIGGYIEVGRREGRMVYQSPTPRGTGYFVPVTIFTDVAAQARIFQEEIFGPILTITRARDLDHALELANATAFALTGGFFSRSPANIARVSAEFEAGNLYINRGITGALVARHPFGGYKMSGGGTKAGGRDYLQHFMFPRVVTENRLRRGFAPGE